PGLGDRHAALVVAAGGAGVRLRASLDRPLLRREESAGDLHLSGLVAGQRLQDVRPVRLGPARQGTDEAPDTFALTMRFLLRHRTTYRYAKPVTLGRHRLMIRPRDSHEMKLHEATLGLTPPGT